MRQVRLECPPVGSVWRVPSKEWLANVNYRRLSSYFRLQKPVLAKSDFRKKPISANKWADFDIARRVLACQAGRNGRLCDIIVLFT